MVTENKEPFFSIIIPVYRDVKRLNLCLDSFSNMTYAGFEFEVIVVNNDPENPKLELDSLVYSYPLKEILEMKPGSYAARNKGILEAKGEVLAFTDSDCLPTSTWLKTAYEIFKNDKRKEIGILTGPVPLFFKDPKNLSPAELYEKYTGGFTTEAYAKEGRAITANWFSYKSVIEEFDGFNEELKSNGDSELSGKISAKYLIIFQEHILVRHPARYHTEELVNKYRRLLGGTFTRKYQHDLRGFKWFLLEFIWKRYRFALKKLVTVSLNESIAIWMVCHAINLGGINEYFDLRNGAETKR